MGLWQTIQQRANKINYQPEKLSLKDIENSFNALYTNRPAFYTPIYMGLKSYVIINLITEFLAINPAIKFWTYIPKRVHNFIYISLFQKHGLFKIKLYTDGRKNKYELFHGTTLISIDDSIKSLTTLNK